MKYMLVAVAIAMAACGRDEGDPVEQATKALETNDYGHALMLVTDLDTDTTTTLSVEQLCRLSLLYMDMSDMHDPDINTALATRCFATATWKNADSARVFYDTLPVEESLHVEILRQLYRIIHAPVTYFPDDEEGMDEEETNEMI